jgi:hypothetical protein
MPVFTAQTLHVEGILIFHNQELSVEYPDNDADVDTVVGGAVGVSPGPDKTIITGTNALPVPGADFDFVLAKHNRTELQCVAQQIGSPKKVAGTFICREVTDGSGTGQQTTQNFRLQSIGTPAPRPQ